MRLLGAKEFLRTVKPGTLFRMYWHDVEICHNIIEAFKNGKINEIQYYSEVAIFGSNSGSLSFHKLTDSDNVIIDNKNYDCLFYYDLNIVGDASPTETLYLVYDSIDEWSDKVNIEESDGEFLTKDELVKIRDWFIENEGPFSDETNGWALQILISDEYYKNNEIVNTNL